MEEEKKEKYSLESLLEKIEKTIIKFIEDFEKNPIKNSIKLLIIYWVIKMIYSSIRRK